MTNDYVKAYPDEQFIVRNSELFSHACKEVLVLKKSSIEYHVNSQKHINEGHSKKDKNPPCT